MKIKIEQKKLKNQTDSFFYENGTIATGTSKHGTEFTLIACGEIRFTINQETYRNEQKYEAIKKHKLTDKKLISLVDKGKIDWINNNWFEVVWLRTGDIYSEFDLGIVAREYDEAISLLKSYIEDDNKNKTYTKRD